MPLQQWLDLVQNRLDDAPHTMIVGPTGTGKTTLVKAICTSRRGDLLFVSPKPNAWPGLQYPTIDDDGGYTAIEQVMQQVLVELKRRLAAMKAGTDPATFPILTIVVDEFPTVVDECPTAPVLYRKLGQIGRELRLRLIALTTTRQVKDLGLEGRGAARENFAEITLPRATARVSGFVQLAADEPAAAIDLTGVLELSQHPIDPARWWIPPVAPPAESSVAPELTTDHRPPTTTAPALTADHLRIAAWLAIESTISNREIARRLFGGDGSGRNGVKAGELRDQVATLLRSAVPGVPGVPAAGNGAEQALREQGTTERLARTA